MNTPNFSFNRSWTRYSPLASSILALVLASVALGTASAQNLVTNGDFDANAAAFGAFPGYLGGANPAAIPNWTFTAGGAGINGTNAPGTGQPFAPANNVPHFLFMQGDFSAEQTITTTNGALYQFSFDAAARSGNAAGVSVYADNTGAPAVVMNRNVPSYGWLNTQSFQHYAFGFTGVGAQTIRFTSSGNGDHTTDIDKVSVTAVPGAMPLVDGTLFFTATSGTVGHAFALTGNNPTIFQQAGAVTYTGNISTDGTGGALNILDYGRQAGLQSLTFSGSTIALGDKSFQTSGANGGNVDSISDANLSLTTLNGVTLTTNTNVVVSRSALQLTGNSQLTVGGQLISGSAWNDFTLGGTSSVSVAGGVDFRNVASHLSLDGGTLTTPSIWGNFTFGGASRTIFNGTRVIATADSADFLKVSHDFDQAAHTAAAEIGNGGAIFDTNGHNVTIANDLANLGNSTGGLTKLGNGTLTIASVAAYNGPTVIDAGTLKLAPFTTSVGAISIANSGFETPNVGPGGFAYNPGGASWGFSSAGIGQNGSPWFVPNALEGVQGGFLQNDGSVINQVISIGASGQYTLSFSAVGRSNAGNPSNGLKIYIDGNLVDAIRNQEFSQSAWQSYSIPIPLTAGNHVLGFLGWNDAGGGDVATVIDAVSLTNGQSGGGTFGSYTAVSIANGATLDLGGNTQAIGSLAGAGTVTSSFARASTLLIGTDNTTTANFTGSIQNGLGTLSLNKIGSGIQTLSGSNTFSGGTTISSGTLRLNSSSALGTGGLTIRSNAVLYPAFSGTASNAISLVGTNPVIFANVNAPVLSGNVSNDGSGGALLIASSGRESGSHVLTFSGNTIALGPKTLRVDGVIGGGNVDSIADAKGQLTVLSNATLTTSANVIVRRGALQVAGASAVTIGGQLISSDAWSSFTLQDTAYVTATGGVDFRAVASQLELNGGTLTTPSIWGNFTFGGASRTIFNGTRIIASADSADFLKMSHDFDLGAHTTAADLANGGLFIDTNGHAIVILNELEDLPGDPGVVTKIGAGTLTLSGLLHYTGPTNIVAGTLIVNSALGFGSNTVNAAGGTTRFTVSQTLGALNIGDGAKVTFGDGLPFAPAPVKFDGLGVVPEPGSIGLLLTAGLVLLGRRRRSATA